MYISGAVVVSIGPKIGWGLAFMLLSIVFLALLPVTLFAPEPEGVPPPPASLRAAVWDPFVSFFRHPRALEIASFLFLYKFSNNVAEALVRPFLGQLGYHPLEVGIATGTISLFANIAGTVLGGLGGGRGAPREARQQQRDSVGEYHRPRDYKHAVDQPQRYADGKSAVHAQ